HAHSSTSVWLHTLAAVAPTLAHTSRSCCSPQPSTALRSWNVCSIAVRRDAVSRIRSADIVGSVLKNASQPDSSRPTTTRSSPPAGRHVARNVLTDLTSSAPYWLTRTSRQPRGCAPRWRRLSRLLP